MNASSKYFNRSRWYSTYVLKNFQTKQNFSFGYPVMRRETLLAVEAEAGVSLGNGSHRLLLGLTASRASLLAAAASSSSSSSSWQAAIWCLWQSQQRGNQTSGQWSTPHSNGYLAAKQKERRPRIKKQDNSLSYYYTSSTTKTVFLFDTWWCQHTYWYAVWYAFTFLGGKTKFK